MAQKGFWGRSAAAGRAVDTMEIDLRTPREKRRDERRREICQAYIGLSDKHPDCKPYRIMTALARQFGMTTPGVKYVLETEGLYRTNLR